MTLMQGRHAVVVGGASGIGAGLCRALTLHGASVDLLDRDVDGGRAVAAALSADGADIHAQFADIVDPESLDRAQAETVRRRGRVDLLFANAGALIIKPFLESSSDDWRWLFEINLLGTVNTVRAFLPGLLAQGGASRIAVTSSISMLRSANFVGQTMYVASKAAQHGFLAALEGELKGSGVALSTIFPGPVATHLKARSESLRGGAIAATGVPGSATADMISGDEAGRIIVDGVARGLRYITTHPREAAKVLARAQEIQAAFA